MIFYQSANFHPGFMCQMSGSVLPFSLAVALPCGLIAAALNAVSSHYLSGEGWSVVGLADGADGENFVEGAAFSGFNFLVGFVVVFRAREAYYRFWEGCSRILAMQGEWFDAASSLCAFCRTQSAEKWRIVTFQHTLVRLFSLLHAAVLSDLCTGSESDGGSSQFDRAFELELIDIEGLDSRSLRTFNESNVKVELCFQWIQQLIVEADTHGVFAVAPPILSRSFQELATGMVEYHQASKIARIPLPFPYVQATELLLAMHWVLTPLLMSMWTGSPLWAFLLTVVQVTFFWSLNSTACELENPFGTDVNDLPAAQLQRDFNERLLLLSRTSTQHPVRQSTRAKGLLNDLRDPGGLQLETSCAFNSGGLKWEHGRRSASEVLGGGASERKSLGDLYRAVAKTVGFSSGSLYDSESNEDKPEISPEAPEVPTSREDMSPVEAVDSCRSSPRSPPRSPTKARGGLQDKAIEVPQLIQIFEEIRDHIRQCYARDPIVREWKEACREVMAEIIGATPYVAPDCRAWYPDVRPPPFRPDGADPEPFPVGLPTTQHVITLNQCREGEAWQQRHDSL